jgi:hypothetical protein
VLAAGVFIPPICPGSRWIKLVPIGRLWTGAATGGCWAENWPRRDRRAGRFGGLPVGFRAAGPGRVEKEAVGLFWLAGSKGNQRTMFFVILF